MIAGMPEQHNYIVVNRKGDSNDPYVEYTETWKVAQNKVILNEIPERLHKVRVKDKDGKYLYETKSQSPSINEYYVDYDNAHVFFNEANEGKKFTFTYFGRGVIKTPYTRIYFDNNSEQETIQTLGEISQESYQNGQYALEQGKYALEQGNAAKTTNENIQAAEEIRVQSENTRQQEHSDRMQEVSDTIENANTTVDNLVQDTNSTVDKLVGDTSYVEQYNSSTQYYKNNIVSFNGNSFIAKQDNIGNQPPIDLEIETENEYWGLIGRRGNDGTGTVHTIKDVFIATEGQTVFTLSRNYDQFQNRTKVTIDGVPQYYPDNYDETSSNTITLSEGVYDGAEVIVEYFSQSVPLQSDIQTTVSNHTTELNNHLTTLNNHTTELNNHTTEITNVKSDLAQIEQEKVNQTDFELTNKEVNFAKKDISKLSAANALRQLVLPSAYGDYEAYHPKPVEFASAWNGYKYWMAFTPYPNGDQGKENPHILASNDLVTWVEPVGIKNPISTPPGNDPSKQYFSDTHLTFNSKLNRLELYWRYVDDNTDKVCIYRKTSTNGTVWSATATILSATRSIQDYVSPAVIYEENKHKMWFVANGYKVWYTESLDDGITWTAPREIVVPYQTKMNNWHLDVIHTDVGYELFVTAFADGQNRNTMSLFHSVSVDNINYSVPKIVLEPSNRAIAWDNMGIYRTGVFKKDGIYYIFYSAVSKDWKRGTGLTYGKDLSHLKGYDQVVIPTIDLTQVIVRRTQTIGLTESNKDYKVFFDTEYRDTKNEMSDNDIFTPNESGMYLITGYFVFSNIAENNTYIKLYKNGIYERALGGGTNQQVFNFSRLVYLNANNTYEFYVSQSSGSSKTVNDFYAEVTKIA